MVGRVIRLDMGRVLSRNGKLILSSRGVIELMGRNETLTFTVGPETPSFNVSVLGTSSIPREIEIC
jgi:hypothetical protein